MSYTINDKEIAAVVALESDKRYSYLIKRIVDWQEIWTLKNEDGFVVLSDGSGTEHVPIWPHRRYAQLLATDEWKNTEPVSIPLNEWMERWIPGLKKDKRMIAAFPIKTGTSVSISPDEHLHHIQIELENYE